MIESVSSYCYGGVDREGGTRIVGHARTKNVKWNHIEITESN